jgi:peptide/nickel transport system ATP-binding protein
MSVPPFPSSGTPRDGDRSVATGDRGRVLEVQGLSVSFYVDGEWVPAAVDLRYHVDAGEVLAIVGESGSGKTQSALSLLGLLPGNGRCSGSAKLNGEQLVGLSGAGLRRVRGREAAVIFQEPSTALNPVYTIGFQIVETLNAHFQLPPRQARTRAVELLGLVEIPEPERRFHTYPHELSGGQRQRAMIAQALACEPRLLIADEPTSALDVTVQAEILKLMRDLRERVDAGVLLITHDMGVVADLADRVLVMQHGRIVESGTVDAIFTSARHPYTRQLLDAVPHFGAGTAVEAAARTQREQVDTPGRASAPVVVAENLVVEYPRRGNQPLHRAVDDVTLTLGTGEVLGLVGESGSGKTTIARAVVGLVPVAGGTLEVAGVQMKGARTRDLRAFRERVGIVFQDPGSSLNPRWPVGESIAEPLVLHRGLRGKALDTAVATLLDRVRLQHGFRNRYPHELSGGQCQRVGIARALALDPELLVADEPTSALDVSVQASVLDLFQELQREQGFACLFISHDLGVVEILASRIAVMHQARIVEMGERDQIVRDPQHEYTRRLVSAVPVPDPAEQRRRRRARDEIIARSGIS